ncbi:hypothetical protein A3A76_03165 [Candidatus Woesebacteria bacterium RIFCSPLOWO2_01_FULL_39_23]|uniref:Uncharacterized protein n=1 Tax=Candidatus Woesebacteria bacterium RIFCSPHIGHO2_01_FULL_40_22 TaxID=1802499 RepID=A0A1F7YJD5_9BACT|nr:MAG: hypothetical protein A2141_00860 [Candidatus Woesebacteria bacterium RBG_16_40_11]OGM27461.1 MAG: hypothetical protein A2628_01565 [Candidatus Woesebacteria bacterium RIFCSPHIGHO2_01_FULL_40_22]OGM36581.1 MAG: hypothetical protein A3E41_04080 [Candidatus Woesebacteria bacterium RIFCSPHIGHO2_12_FULL_38_9]OGM62635.1 MAG: hypothetical protein A3A76_03165 [Candidatus Woesebacteria bacterium RIFCSPLOWO2_01_FULL_39_23]
MAKKAIKSKNKKQVSSAGTKKSLAKKSNNNKNALFPQIKSNRIIILASVAILLVIVLNALFRRYFIASVNGRLIARHQLYSELEKKDKGKVLEDIITKEIIFQEAKNNNIKISRDEITSELAKISESINQQGSNLNDVLALQGMTLEELRENIEIQKILEKLLQHKISISDEEIQQRFDDNKSSYSPETKYDDVKESLKAQIFQEKLSDLYRSWIEEKRTNLKVKYFM